MLMSLQIGPMMAGCPPNRPGGGEDCIDDRIFGVFGWEQENVL